MIRIQEMLRSIRTPFLVALTLALLIQAAFALEVPLLRARVNDHAEMLSQGVEAQLELLLKDFEEKDSTQIVILTIPSLEGEVLEDFSMRVAEKWRIGQKGLDNGAILLISRADRKVRIEVGYGLEGRLTDLQAGRIIRGIIVPEFKAGRFDQGVVNGVQAMIAAVRGEFNSEDKKGTGGFGSENFAEALPLLLLFVFIVFSFGRVNRFLGTAAGGFFMPFLGKMAFSPGLGVLAALAGIGLAAGFIISAIAGLAQIAGPPSTGRRSGGGYGGFPGGFSSGGGFSGGGGGFGGGGSSGSW